MTSTLLISEPLFVKNRSKIDSVVSVILVGSVTSCCRNRLLVMSMSCEQSVGFVADGQTLLSVQLISARLKSPPIHTCAPVHTGFINLIYMNPPKAPTSNVYDCILYTLCKCSDETENS